MSAIQRVFRHINQVNLWESAESVSGRGSELALTESLRSTLAKLLQDRGIRSMLDAPCGDFNWMSRVPLADIDYLGIEVIPELVESNSQRYSNPALKFQVGDLTQDELPQRDLIFCRDCLVHLPLRSGCQALLQFYKSRSPYLLVTTYPSVTINRDSPTGSWRPLNLCLPPFNLPVPLELIPDPSDDTGANPDKSMGLWDLTALSAPLVPRFESPYVALIGWIRRYWPSWQL